MPKKEVEEMTETEVDSILDGLVGDLRIGQKYYLFTVTYHYIGRVAKISRNGATVTLEDAHIVTTAGSAADAVSQIVQGKAKPEIWEKPGKPIIIFTQSLTCAIPF
ncbi:MAG: hypothetical protein KGI66_04550 [Patescibacteria group bacterium]|nr:hypothetical protein [Patescibacteria group bacterium]